MTRGRFDHPFDVDHLIGQGKLKHLYELLMRRHHADLDPSGRARVDIERMLEFAFQNLSKHYGDVKNAAMKAVIKLQKEALNFYDHALHSSERPDVAHLEKILRDMDAEMARLGRGAEELAGEVAGDVARDVPTPTKQSAQVPDPQRQVKATAAKTALEQQAAADTATFRGSADETRRLQGRLKELAANPKKAPAELRKALDELPPIDDLEARLEAIKELEARPGHSGAAAEYLRWQRELLDVRNELRDIQLGNKAGGAVAERRATVELPQADVELRAASRPVRELLRGDGPNYRKASKTTHDQVIGEARWKEMSEKLKPEQRALATDHLVPLDQIGNSPELANFLKLYEKASDAVKADMTRDLIALGDRPDNLVRMRADANGASLKGSKKWADITYNQAKEFGYDPPDVDFMRGREADVSKAIKQGIDQLVKDYGNIIAGAPK